MFKHLVALIITLQFLAGSAFAAKTVIVDGNPATRSPGTRVTAAYLNGLSNHRHDGKDADGSGVLDYAVDTGSANALVIALNPALTAQVEGMPVWVKVAATNTGATTLKVNALAPAPLYKLGNQALDAGDIRAGQVIGVAWNGTAFALTNYQSPPVTDATTLQGQTAAQLVPSGAVMPFAMPSVPLGWLLCDGRAVLRSQYPNLYAAIGTTWGAGDGISTFNLPDLRGEFIRGWDGSGPTARGVDAGRAIASWQDDQFRAHTHTVNHDMYRVQAGSRDTGVWNSVGTETNAPSTTSSAGGTETRPRNVALMYCIHY